MPVATDAARRNGATAATMPIKTARLVFDDVGYPGWYAEVRLNPRTSVYLQLFEEQAAWAAWGQVVLEWNFVQEDSTPYALPKQAASLIELDLPAGLWPRLQQLYFDTFSASSTPPKEPASDSATSSSINGAKPGSG